MSKLHAGKILEVANMSVLWRQLFLGGLIEFLAPGQLLLWVCILVDYLRREGT